MRRWLFGLAVVACAMPAHAGPDIRPPPAWATTLELPEASVTAATRSDAGLRYVLLDHQSALTGRRPVSYRRFVFDVTSESGLSEAGRLDIQFQPDYEVVVLHSVSVLRDGVSQARAAGLGFERLRRETELDDFITLTNIKPALVVTDSQAFEFVSRIVPEDIPLTGFSILFARLKGDFEKYTEGTRKLGDLKDGDKVLILESCSHRVSCDDIGRHKIPAWIQNKSGKDIQFEVVSGLDQSREPFTNYALVIQCGGCVFTRRQVLNRLKPAIEAGIPVTNYGMAIAWLKGIFDRAIKPLTK